MWGQGLLSSFSAQLLEYHASIYGDGMSLVYVEMLRVEYVLVWGQGLLPSFSAQLLESHASIYGDRDYGSLDVNS